MQGIIDFLNNYLSGYVLVILLVAIGVFYTVKTRFVQLRCFGEGIRGLFSRGGSDQGGLSSFQALATAVAAQVGTGNIVGACGAILVGGPGAIFWMWVIAFFGMATNYAEAVLAQKTREIGEDGEIRGGPVYYIKAAFKGRLGRALSGFFAVAIIIACGFIGAMVQSNSIVSNISGVVASLGGDAGDYLWIMGLAVALLAGVIFIGGIKRIASVTEKLVPIMALLYILGGILVLAVNI